jgi:transposase
MEARRFVGIDLGKRHYEACVLHAGEKIIRWNGTTNTAGRDELAGKLERGDVVALEAGALSFTLARRLSQVEGVGVMVLHAAKLAVIYSSMRKTDKEDALKLAKVLQNTTEECLPVVRIPNEKEEEARRLANHQIFLHHGRTQMINRFHSLCVENGLTDITKKDLRNDTGRKAVLEQMTGIYRILAEQHCVMLVAIESLLELAKEQVRQALLDRNAETEILMSIPGVGPTAALAYLGFVGTEDRFNNPSQVSYYVGMVPRVDLSGISVHRMGHITKQGSPALRRALVQAAWSAVRSPMGAHFRAVYDRIAERRGKRVAIVAVARHMLELMYTLIQKHEMYRFCSEEERRHKLKFYKLGSLGTVGFLT